MQPEDRIRELESRIDDELEDELNDQGQRLETGARTEAPAKYSTTPAGTKGFLRLARLDIYFSVCLHRGWFLQGCGDLLVEEVELMAHC